VNTKKEVMAIVSQKGMYSCMNDTKWKELQTAMDGLPFPPPYVLKTVCEEETAQHKFDNDVWYIGDWSDEALLWGDFYAIEWVKIRPCYTEHQGRLIPDKLIDETEDFLTVLKKINVPFEEQNGTYTIYGYRTE